jgi:hypothetical protein
VRGPGVISCRVVLCRVVLALARVVEMRGERCEGRGARGEERGPREREPDFLGRKARRVWSRSVEDGWWIRDADGAKEGV